MSRTRTSRHKYRWLQHSLEFGGGFTLFLAFIHVTFSAQFDVFVRVMVPILATYIGTAALLYNRARALRRGRAKFRSLYVAERALQAAVFTLVGLLIGTALFGWLYWFETSIPVKSPTWKPTLFLYFIPFAFILWGYSSFVLSLRVLATEFMRHVHVREISRRIKNAP